MMSKKMSMVYLLVSITLSCGSQVRTPEPPTFNKATKIQLTLSNVGQVIDGFGASDAWRCQMVGKYWPLDKRNAIADLLFSREMDAQGNPKGIGLSIWRFYIGAGSAEQGAASNITDAWRRGESFQAADGSYDWSKQEGQRWFLQAAKQRGVDQFLAFTISPPVHMTKNSKAYAPDESPNMNIQAGKLGDYATFLVDVVEQLQQREGITFDYLSPVNEPQWSWNANASAQAKQEGTQATNGEVAQFTRLLSEKIQQRSLATELVLGEAGAINYLYERVNSEDRDDQIAAFFGNNSTHRIADLPGVRNTISGHSYFSVWPIEQQVAYRQQLRDKLHQVSPSLGYWQTEYCILEQPGEQEIPGGSGSKRDLGMKTALFVARIIHNDLAIANASSWQWWTALTRHDFKDGLIYLDDGNSDGVSGNDEEYCKEDGQYRASKLLWAFGNYARFITPGMVRLNIEDTDPVQAAKGVMVSAYHDPASKKVVLVAVNTTGAAKDYHIEGVELKKDELTPYLTAETASLTKQIAVKASGFSVPALSVVTYVGELN